MTKSLTSGSPFKLILNFAIPFLLVQVFQQIYNIADTLIVGRILGTNAMAAVGSTGSLAWLTIAIPSSLGLGFSMLTAQFFGAKNEKGVKKSYSNSFVMTFAISTIISAIGTIFLFDILKIFQFPDEIISDTYSYFIWITLGILPNGLFLLNSNMLRALGVSKIPTLLSILSCVLNIILDIVCIGIFKMGTAGAGFATFISQIGACVICHIYLFGNFPELRFSYKDLGLNKDIAVKLLKLGIPVAVFDVVNASGGVIGQYATNYMGIELVTASTVANKVLSFMYTPLFAIGSSLTVYTAQNYGAKEFKRIKQGVNSSIIMKLLWNVVMIVTALLLSDILCSFVGSTSDEYILKNAKYYLVMNCGCSVFLSAILVYRSPLQACGFNTAPVISSFAELSAKLICAFYIVKVAGYHGVVLLNPLTWLFAGIVNMIGYYIFLHKIKKPAATS